MKLLVNQLPERFTSKYVADGDCWRWVAAKGSKGYGRYHADDRNKLAYHWAWEQVNGAVPPGLVLDHYRYPDGGCIGPACVNPDHVRPVTSRENTVRSTKTMAGSYLAATHCVGGHELTPDNTGWYESRGRFCVQCGPAASRLLKG